MKIIYLTKYFFFFLFFVSFAASIFSQQSAELTGTIISYDRCNDTEFPVSNAFDNNTDTYFMSCPPFGNWIGLDLGTKHIITKIAYSPRMDGEYRERLQLAVFEGSNNPDFGDAIALFIIPALTERVLTEQEIECTRGFRYVRLVLPYAQNTSKSSYVSELKFFGYQGEGNDAKLPQLTNLPTISIHTVNTQDITSKETYVKGIISVIYDNGTKIYTDSLEIRGRGNNSWTHPKKPYRLKLQTSTNFMDLPAKGRNWTLINNYGDKTLMRNMLAFDFSKRLEMPYTSPAEAVDVVLNGDYKGCYQLCDHIDVRKNRVDIEEMSSTDLTGGYMIEIDAYADEEPKKFTSSAYGIPVTIKYPDEDDITPTQEQYIASHFESLVSTTQGGNYKDSQNGFRKYMDLESFLRHFLVGEYSGNTDTYWSVRMTKQKDDDKFYFGPVWDFDLAFENDNRTYPINANASVTNKWLYNSDGSSAAGGTRDFVNRILSDQNVENRLEEIYAHYRDNGKISENALINVVDSFATKINVSQQLNFKRWNIMNSYVHMNPAIYGSYEGEVNNVKNYIRGRINWIDNKLNYEPGQTSDKLNEVLDISIDKNVILIEYPDSYSVQIFDLYGNLIKSESNLRAISTFNLFGGVYIVKVTTLSGQKFVQKCIVS